MKDRSDLMKKFVNYIFIVSIIGILTYTIFNKGKKIVNPYKTMTISVTNEIVPYSTEYIYNDKRPSTSKELIITPGVNGLDYTYDGLNYVHLSDVKNEVIEVGTGKAGEYTGMLTGYGPDCYGCSSVGNVSCMTREGTKHSLTNNGIYYNDSVYGKLRILAADNNEFPCGTVVILSNSKIGEIRGIVLDTGITMINAMRNGQIWFDLAFASESEASKATVTNSNTKYSVQRWGW